MPLPFTLSRLRPTLALAAALLVWTGCDSNEQNFDTPPAFAESENVVPAFDRDGNEVGEVSLTRLFAEPSQLELDAALAAVSGRDNGVYDYQSIGTVPTPLGVLHIVSHTVRAAPQGQEFPTHYGAIHVPSDLDGSPRENLPVLVYSHGGDNGVEAVQPFALFGLIDPATGLPNPTPDPAVVQFASSVVMVIPTFRSEELRTAGLGLPQPSYTSTGLPSPWDYDVDDALTLVNVALDQFGDATDESRIGTLGFSRGGAVALLMSVRDDRIDVVTDFFGPADFFEAQFQGLAAALLGGPAGSAGQAGQEFALQLPGADFILDALLTPLSQAGPNGIAYAQARQAVLLRSAAYYTERMPDLQVHHHYGDAVVPVSQSEALEAQVNSEPVDGVSQFNYYGEEGTTPSTSFHNPAAFPESIPATLQFHFANLIGN